MLDRSVDPKLLALLACPSCDDRPPLSLAPDAGTLDCAKCGRRYPIENGIPILLVDFALEGSLSDASEDHVND